jgi:L-fucose mutarotase/ribose pyranase (RbsD/FucU family)
MHQTRRPYHPGGVRSGEISKIFVMRSFAFGPDTAVPGDQQDPAFEQHYSEVVRLRYLQAAAPQRIDRFAIYDHAKSV